MPQSLRLGMLYFSILSFINNILFLGLGGAGQRHLRIFSKFLPKANLYAWRAKKKTPTLNENFTVHCGLAIGYENTKNKINTLKTERASLENFCKFI